MISLEAIGVLGILYLFFTVGTVKVLRANSPVRREGGLQSFVKGPFPGTASPAV